MSPLSGQNSPSRIAPAFKRVACESGQSQSRSRPAPFSLRLSANERGWLEERAGGRPLGTYIRSRLFGDDDVLERRAVPRTPKTNTKELARLLTTLGQSRLSQNMNQIAKAANMGVIECSPELEAELHLACREISDMRSMLVRALGIQPVDQS